jgi:hypothetical protein
MATTLKVSFGSQGVPTVARWQAALDEAGFDVQFDPGADPLTHTGFWPLRCGERECGFAKNGRTNFDSAGNRGVT